MFTGVQPQGAANGGRWAAAQAFPRGEVVCAAQMASEGVGFQDPSCELLRTGLAYRDAG